jgi:hypothetical protein
LYQSGTYTSPDNSRHGSLIRAAKDADKERELGHAGTNCRTFLELGMRKSNYICPGSLLAFRSLLVIGRAVRPICALPD